jgi:hypothetical protein
MSLNSSDGICQATFNTVNVVKTGEFIVLFHSVSLFWRDCCRRFQVIVIGEMIVL